MAFLDDPVGSINNAIRSSPAGGLLGQFTSGGTPSTKTRTGHALSLHVQLPGKAPRLIGAVQSIQFSQARDLDEEYEINALGTGLPVDLVPQRVTERTMRVERLDLYLSIFEEVFGHREIVVLSDQFLPLSLREVWRDPSGSLSNPFAVTSKAYMYSGIFIKDFGRQVASNGDLIVRTNALLVWQNKTRII